MHRRRSPSELFALRKHVAVCQRRFALTKTTSLEWPMYVRCHWPHHFSHQLCRASGCLLLVDRDGFDRETNAAVASVVVDKVTGHHHQIAAAWAQCPLGADLRSSRDK